MHMRITSTILLVIGLFRPWVVLWWEDLQNRKKVIRVYGTLAVVSLIVHYVVRNLLG